MNGSICLINYLIILRIEHVGSTSIPGMDTKPIIDLVIEVSAIDFNNIKIELENIGYIHSGNQGIDGEKYLIDWAIISRF